VNLQNKYMYINPSQHSTSISI